jgi:hypothetical protein
LSKDGPALPEGWEMVPYPESGPNKFKFVNMQLKMTIKYPPQSERGLTEIDKLTSGGAVMHLSFSLPLLMDWRPLMSERLVGRICVSHCFCACRQWRPFPCRLQP